MTAEAMAALGAEPLTGRQYGPADDAATMLMAAGRRVALLYGIAGPPWCLDGDRMSAAELARLAAGLPPPPARRYGRSVDQSEMVKRGPCPACGEPTITGWRERDAGGRWRDVSWPPAPCTGCRVARALAGEPVWRVRPRVVPVADHAGRHVSAALTGGIPAAWWAPESRNANDLVTMAPDKVDQGFRRSEACEPAAPTDTFPQVRGLRPQTLTTHKDPDVSAGQSVTAPTEAPQNRSETNSQVRGRPRAPLPASAVVVGRRVFADGRQLATIPPPPEGTQ